MSKGGKATIHPTAVVDRDAMLGPGSVVEPFAIVGAGVEVGAEATIGARATVTGLTRIGAGCHIGVGAVIGGAPQDRKYTGEPTRVEIGDGTHVRDYSTINRGTQAAGVTRIGKRCFIMSYVHIAHDCRIGDDVVLANAVQLAGHVDIDDGAQVGGSSPIHQFVRIGRLSFVGGGSRVPRDVPPFALAAGYPMHLYGINAEGLRRAGFDSATRLALKRAFRLLFNANTSRGESVTRIDAELGHVPEVAHLVEFVTRSDRGVLV